MRNRILAASLLLPLWAARAWAGPALDHIQNEAQFMRAVNDALRSVKPQDAFQIEGACRIVDARILRAYAPAEAARALKPCLDALSSRYDVRLEAAAEADAGLAIYTGGVAPGSLRLADLRQGLSARKNVLLGHPARLERERAPKPSLLQSAVDSCMLIQIVREMESSVDFIRHYGACILRDKALGVKELKPEPRDPKALEVYAARTASAEDLSGIVSVSAGHGPVAFTVTAFVK